MLALLGLLPRKVYSVGKGDVFKEVEEVPGMVEAGFTNEVYERVKEQYE